MCCGVSLTFSALLVVGKPALLVCWAGACPVCRRELPEVQEVYEAFDDEVVFVGLDVGAYTGLGDRDDALALIETLGMTFPAGGSPEPTVLQAYRVTGIPTTLLFKADGELFHRFDGLTDRETLREQVEALVAATEG